MAEALKPPAAKRSRRSATAEPKLPPALRLPSSPPIAKKHSDAKEARSVRRTVGAFQEGQRKTVRELAKERHAAQVDARKAKQLGGVLKSLKASRNTGPKEPGTHESLSSPQAFADGRRQKCTAHRTNGSPCARWAMRMQLVCGAHGGRSPQALKSAKERFMDLFDPAYKGFCAMIETPVQDLDRFSKGYAIKKGLFEGVFDRTGMHPRSGMDVNLSSPGKARAAMAELLGVPESELAAMEAEATAPSPWPKLPSANPAALPAAPIGEREDETADTWSTFYAHTSEAEAVATLAALESREDAQAALAAELLGAKRESVVQAALSSPGWTGQTAIEPPGDLDPDVEPVADPEGWIEV
jgi:hypothetical protein